MELVGVGLVLGNLDEILQHVAQIKQLMQPVEQHIIQMLLPHQQQIFVLQGLLLQYHEQGLLLGIVLDRMDEMLYLVRLASPKMLRVELQMDNHLPMLLLPIFVVIILLLQQFLHELVGRGHVLGRMDEPHRLVQQIFLK